MGGEKAVRVEGLKLEGCSTYIGEVNEAGQPHGAGVRTNRDGSRAEGRWREGVRIELVAPWTGGVRPVGSKAGGEAYGRYEGEGRGGRPHGHGWIAFGDGRRFEGAFRAGLADGPGVMVLPDGRRFEGTFATRAGAIVLHGEGAVERPGGVRFEGTFDRGDPSGRGSLTLPDGQRFNGEWRGGRCYAGKVGADGQPHGRGVLVFLNGARYEGAFEGGEPSGQGAVTLADGTELAAGEWRTGAHYEGDTDTAGRPHGKGVLTGPDGERFEGAFVDGRKEGPGVKTWPGVSARFDGEYSGGKLARPGTYTVPERRRAA